MSSSNAMLSLKEFLLHDASCRDFCQLIKDIQAVLFDEVHPNLPILDKLEISSEVMKTLIENPNNHALFCRAIFTCASKITSKGGAATKIPWTQVNQIVLKPATDTTLLNLLDCFVHLKELHSVVQAKLADCFEHAMDKKYFTAIIWSQCLVKPVKTPYGKSSVEPSVAMQWNQLIQCFVSLPDKISNRLKLKTSAMFHPQSYFLWLSVCVSEVLEKMYDHLRKSGECSLAFLSHLLGKICTTGHGSQLFSVLVPNMLKWTTQTPLWCRICANLFLYIPDTMLEPCIEPLLKEVPNLDLVVRLLGDSILSKPKLKLLFTHKFLLTRTYEADQIPYNILGYLASKCVFERCFKETVLKLLGVWGERNAIKHTSLEQHMYVTRCLLIAIGLLSKKQKEEWRSELMMKLMEGVPSHLESANDQLHQVGMIVAQCLTTSLDEEGKTKLNFEMEKTEQVEYLFHLCRNPGEAIEQKSARDSAEKEVSVTKQCSPVGAGGKELDEKPEINYVAANKDSDEDEDDDREELDSDDDLQPYNLDEEDEFTSVNGVRAPVYLRECISGLLSTNDVNRMEACLRVVKNIVMKEPGDLPDIAVELVKILLHLTDDYSIDNFVKLRLDAMVEVTVKCPADVAEYLCEQFYTENYSLLQRCDVLEVISTAALRLSSAVVEKSAEEVRSHLPLPIVPGQRPPINEKPKWREIVDDRVASKTRRFVNGPTKQLPPSKKNRFADVAGLFFFPLLKKFGVRMDTCDMFGRDTFVLGKLVYSLCAVLRASHGLPVASHMARTLFEDVVLPLRCHGEALVRQAVVYACSMIVLNVPAFVLMMDLATEMGEAREWLQELIKHDTDEESRKLAASCLMMMHKTMQNQLNDTGNG